MRFLALFAVLAALCLPAQHVLAKQEEKAVKPSVSMTFEKDPDAIVTELFTSQGCSSCPPAQDYLLQLARRSDVITLEYHVDYWDNLSTWLGGKWKDPFSAPAWTERQSDYNEKVTNSGRNYTPQIVIDGRFQAVGSNKATINTLIDEARAVRKRKFTVTPSVAPDGDMSVVVDGPGINQTAHVILLRLLRQASTDVQGGENKGAVMRGHNIVRSLMLIGTWEGGKERFAFKLPEFKAGEEGCAVLLQEPDTMKVLSAGLCAM